MSKDAYRDYMNIAKQHFSNKSYKDALSFYDKAIALYPNLSTPYYNKSLVYEKTDQHEKAAANREIAFRLDPGLIEEWNSIAEAVASGLIELGNDCITAGDFDEAMSCYDRAAWLVPSKAAANIGRGVALSSKGQAAEAIEAYTRAIEIDPTSALAYFNRGVCYFEDHQYDEAISDFNKCIQLDPSDADAYLYRSQAHEAKHDFEMARRDKAEAVRLNPELGNESKTAS